MNEWTHEVIGGPWPDRIGHRCRVVPDPGTGIYPWDKPHKRSAVVLIENDPHADVVYSFGPDRGWTCVIGREALVPIGAAGAHDATQEDEA